MVKNNINVTNLTISKYNCVFFYVLVTGILCLIAYRYYNSYKSKIRSGFSNFISKQAGNYPSADDLPILTDVYPYTGSKHVTDNTYNDIWWHYPIFREGSYKQITNNLRYYNNPDEGTCIRADFCGALYKEKDNKSNYIYPLPPVPHGTKPRVNYYRTNVDLLL